MASDKLADLEAKVRSLIERSDQLKRRNAQLAERLRDADTRLSGQAATLRRWEKEREWLRGRLRKALDELDSIEFEGDRDENLRG
jgi:chromosome segregation ATPase